MNCRSEQKLNVLYLIPRYLTYGMAGHYVMPMGILYVSAYVKRSGVCNVFTLNMNHVEGMPAEDAVRCRWKGQSLRYWTDSATNIKSM